MEVLGVGTVPQQVGEFPAPGRLTGQGQREVISAVVSGSGGTAGRGPQEGPPPTVPEGSAPGTAKRR